MPTRKEVARTNATSFAKLLEEILPFNPNVKDLYYCDHTGVWCINYQEGDFDEFGSFHEIAQGLRMSALG